MSEELTAAQYRASAAEQRAQAAEADRDAAVAKARADAEQTLTQARADNARERDELRADLRARAERAKHQADAYRAELDRVHASALRPRARRAARQDGPAGHARPGRPASDGDRPVNRLGTEAPEHWPAYLPGSYGRLEDPEEFFTELGEQADAEIEDRYLSNTRGRMSPGQVCATTAEAEQRAQRRS
jgi:hypothetical protein